MKKTVVRISAIALIMLAGYNLQAAKSTVADTEYNSPVSNEDTVYQTCEHMAEFPGGFDALGRYMMTTLKYPKAALEKEIMGTVFVRFVINTDGTVTDVEVIKGIGYGCDEEAVRAVKAMPRWKPARDKGKTVRQQFNMPINFMKELNKK